MKKLYLMMKPELFQGEKFLTKKSNYFEGWYFKNIINNEGISFIPGISITDGEKKSFVQVITNDFSCFINYNIDDFEYNYDPFYIKIANNYFSKDSIHVELNDEEFDVHIYGDLKYTESINIKSNILSPNIMGIFSFVPFMQCNHAILCMKNKINGEIIINNKKIDFSNGIGYIEKDFGCSFPKYYMWVQGNNFNNTDSSFMLSIADIPFKLFNFRGLICSLIINDKEYRFATYNNSKIVKYEVNDNVIDIVLKKGKYILNISSKISDSLGLIAPVEGKMDKEIFESINSNVRVILKENNKILFDDISSNCGLEVVL